ncbi:hypothetical protein G6F65_021963 [Rhizopus arrhizus]|nr:hypothetical protein G6F65_021963 [Rhizopus arrhizus]
MSASAIASTVITTACASSASCRVLCTAPWRPSSVAIAMRKLSASRVSLSQRSADSGSSTASTCWHSASMPAASGIGPDTRPSSSSSRSSG